MINLKTCLPILAGATCLACAAATVQAEEPVKTGENEIIKIHGQVRVSVDNTSTDGTDGSSTGIVSNASRFGVTGSIDTNLPETQVIYLMDWRYETTNSVNGEGTKAKQVEFRDAHAGLKGGWGQTRVGRLSTAYKTTLTSIDPWNDNAPESRSGGKQGSSELHSSYFNNAFDYTTPKIAGGLTASVWTAVADTQSDWPLHNAGNINNYRGGSAKGAGIRYATDSIFVSADYIDMDADSLQDDGGNPVTNIFNDRGWQVAGRFKSGNMSVAAFYENVEDLGLGKNTYANFIYKIELTRVILASGRVRDGVAIADTDNTSLGAKYALTKKSELIAAYDIRTDKATDQETKIATIGINAKFGY